MQRDHLLTMLGRYLEVYPEEEPVVRRICELVSSSPDCFERTCRPGHITGSAWVLSHDRKNCMLVHHRKLNRWLQPGGHADGDPRVEQVALREAQEESGLSQLQLVHAGEHLLPLDVDVHVIPDRRDSSGNLLEDAHEHHDIRFLVHAATDAQPVTSEESYDVRWFAADQIWEVTDEPGILRLLRKGGPR